MDVALLAASLAILVWMCAQTALLARRPRPVHDRQKPRGVPATGIASSRLAVAEREPSVN